MNESKAVNISDKKKEDLLKDARDRFREAERGMEHIIESAKDDLQMVDGESQWDAKVETFRRDHGLVVVTENLLPSFLDQVEGDFRQNRPQINVTAVDDKADPETARILGGMIRNINNQSQAEMIYNEAFLMTLASGFGAWRIHTQYEDHLSFDKEIVTLPIENHMAVRWDMSCKKFDTSDKKWCIISQVMDRKEYDDKYGQSSDAGALTPSGDEFSGWFIADKVRVAEYWYIDEKEETIVQLDTGETLKKSELQQYAIGFALASKGAPLPRIVNERKTTIPQVYTCIISGTEILEGPFEWPGKYIPIVISFGKRLNLNGKMKLKSLIRDAKESQRMHNYLISSMVQSVAMQAKAPYIGTTKQFQGKAQEWKAGMDGDVPFLTYNPDPDAPGVPQRQTPPMTSPGHSELIMLNSKTRQDIIGIHDAGLGKASNETSGRAIMARQKEGDIGTFVFIDNFRHALTFDGRIKVDLIPKIYDTPRMQRITGIDGKEEFVQLYEQAMGPRGPYLKANPKVGKYDVVVTTGPSFSTQREETRNAMIQMMQAAPNAAPVLLPGVVNSMDWQDGDRIARALIASLPPEIQQIMNDDAKGGDGKQDPKMMAMQQAMSQQVEKMQEQMAGFAEAAHKEIDKLTKENERLQAGHDIKIAEIEQKRDVSFAEIQLEREKILAEKESQDRQFKHEIEKLRDEMKAKMALELTLFIEKMKAEHRMEAKEEKNEKDGSEKEGQEA